MKRKFAILILSAGLLSGCATTSKEKDIPDNRDTDPMITQLSATARQAYEAGEVADAAALYSRALERSRAVDNSREIGRNASNLAACMIALDQLNEASALLVEAERETIRAGDDAGPILILSSEIFIKNAQWDEAESAIDRLEAMTVRDNIRGQAYVQRARIYCERKNAGLAEGYLNRARGFLRKEQDPGLAGSISEVSGRIAMLNEKWSDAAKSFDREAAWMQKSTRLQEMAEALERAGQNYAKADDNKTAMDRFFRSARSLMAQGNYLDALRVIEQAVQITDSDSNNAETVAAITSLFDEIRLSVEKNSRAGVSPVK
jgi:tetratricopeptide (TPR) repeat protein